MNNKTIFYSSALCGKGKTELAIRHYSAMLKDDPEITLLCTTLSIELSNQIKTRFEIETYFTDAFDIKCIDSDNSDNDLNSVMYQTIEFLAPDARRKAKIAIITHNNLFNLLANPAFIDDCDLSKMILVIDEHPQQIFTHDQMLKLKKNSVFDEFRSHLNIDHDSIVNVPQESRELVERVRRQDEKLPADYLNRKIKVIAETALNPLYQLEFLSREDDLDTLRWVATMQPNALLKFKETTITSALFTSSLIYQLWSSNHDVLFQPHPVFEHLDKLKHNNGHRLKIHYLLEDESWTTYKVNTIQEAAVKEAAKILSSIDLSQPILYRVNKKHEKRINSEKHDKLTCLEYSPHGQNQYRGIHNIIYLQSEMPDKYAQDHFLAKGIQKHEIREFWYHHRMYQTVMRSSLRDDTATAVVNVVVGAKADAMRLQRLFKGSQIALMETEACRPLNTKKSKKIGRSVIPEKERLSKAEQKQINRIVNNLQDKIDRNILSHHKRELFVSIRKLGGLTNKQIYRKYREMLYNLYDYNEY